jgi:hypothetical protein
VKNGGFENYIFWFSKVVFQVLVGMDFSEKVQAELGDLIKLLEVKKGPKTKLFEILHTFK